MGERYVAILALERPAHVTAEAVVAQAGKRFPDNRVPVSNAVIAARTLGTIGYLLAQRPVLKDGDSLGVSEKERIRVAYAAQGYKPGVPVLQLHVESLDNPKRAAAGRGGR